MERKFYSSLFTGKEDVEAIHEKSIYLLENKGILFDCEEARDIFAKNGCRVDGKIVYITEELVNKAIAAVPKTFDMYSRGMKFTTGIGQETMVQSSLGPVNVLDAGVYRKANDVDFINFVKMHQDSDIMHLIDCDLVVPNNVPTKNHLDWTTLATLKYSDKLVGGHNGPKARCEKFIKLVQDFNDDHEHCQTITLATNSAPFAWNKEMCETIITYAEMGQSLVITGVGLAGMTSPPALAATTIQNNTELLAGLTLAELIKPGTPVIYQLSSLECDLRYSLCVCGGAETSQSFFTMRELASYYNLPCRSNGCLSDAKADDYQSGMESFMIALSGYMCEPEQIYMLGGILDSYGALGYEKFMLDEQTARIIKHFLKGTTVNDQTMMMDKMEKIEHKTNYIARTNKLYKADFYLPQLFNRQSIGNWEAAGSPSVQELAGKAWKKRVAEYELPTQLAAYQEKMIADLIPKEFMF
ncbi:MAG: trimethylamine methyltransferase family protein [Eubacterium sp.]